MPPPVWREVQKQNFRNLDLLAQFLELERTSIGSRSSFPLNLPLRLAQKIEKGRLDDPLLRQFVPLQEEDRAAPGFLDDPVQDASFCKADALLQKYAGRALLLTSSACAMHCRYCFRQNFAYPSKSSFAREIALLQADPTIQEIILSGGDPLSLSDPALGQLLASLEQIPHLKLIRFHTRFPMGIPERITPQLLDLFAASRKQLYFVVHANHPREFDEEVFASLKSIRKLGIPVLVQSVLLKGVNDSVETLQALFEGCAWHGVLPYYLYQLDKVSSASHFEVSDERGQELLRALRVKVPGYALPRFVREVPGEKSKTPITF